MKNRLAKTFTSGLLLTMLMFVATACGFGGEREGVEEQEGIGNVEENENEQEEDEQGDQEDEDDND
jgi:hypothetical protein